MIRNKKCKMLQRLIIILIISTMLLNVAGCGSYSTQDSNQTNNSDTLTEQTKDDEEIQFSDFLVERCVRKTLNKSWDDKITKSEVAEIKSLLIDPVYNPSIGMNFMSSGYPNCDFYEGYIDLIDLKYLTGLEILKIDNLAKYDMVVNVDSIANCKKLKKLYMQWGTDCWSANGGIGYGYRYWTDIISELPDLEYIDLGMYVAPHMKDIMLSKTSNKDITIYNGYNDRYSAQRPSSYPNPMVLTDVEHYEGTFKYEYNGSDIEFDEENKSQLGKIPMLKINSYEELQRAVNSLSDTTEDLCIRLWKECTEFDCAMLAKFKNLCTLTITKAGSFLGPNKVDLKNIDILAEIPHLQVINLGLCKGDISGLQNVKKLRELSLVGCEVTGYASLGKADKLTELKVLYSGEDNFSGELSKEGSSLKNLKYYRCYLEEGVVEAQYMSNLQTLSACHGLHDLSILKDYSELENLEIHADSVGGDDLSKITSLNKLKTIVITDGKIVNVGEILKLPNIVSVVLPTGYRDMENYRTNEEMNMLFREAASHDKLSMFCILSIYKYWDLAYFDWYVGQLDKQVFKTLYDKGINDWLTQYAMIYGDGEKTFEELWSQNFN